MKSRIIILAFSLCVLGCHKDKSIILDTALTNCPANSTCTYSYFDHADFTAISPVKNGAYRVFVYTQAYNNPCGRVAHFYLKVSLNSSEFVTNLNPSSTPQIIIASDDNCPCCARATSESFIGGEIKGRRVSPTTWLLNARLTFGYLAQPTDTLKVNQYFTLSKLP